MPDIRKALLVGIDEYPEAALDGCVADAKAMAQILKFHANGDLNFSTITVTSETEKITRAFLRDRLAELFDAADNADLLFYFSGHGAVSTLGPELVTIDYEAPSSWGVSMHDLAELANASSAKSITVILDCCFSGAFGQGDAGKRAERLGLITLRAGVSLLAASRESETAEEWDGHGGFTRVLLQGLSGVAANVHGDVTAAGLHVVAEAAFTDAWGQHPILKSHSLGSPVLRRCEPRVARDALRQAAEIFPDANDTVVLPIAQLAPGAEAIGTPEIDTSSGRGRSHVCAGWPRRIFEHRWRQRRGLLDRARSAFPFARSSRARLASGRSRKEAAGTHV